MTATRRPNPAGNVVILGCARNCAATIAADVQRISAATVGFSGRRWLVVESDSDDETVARLQELKDTRPGFDFLSLGRLRDRIPDRVARIAHCRQTALERARGCGDFGGADYVIVADLDGINDIVDRTALESCFARSDWDVCAANPTGPYYDIFALRHPVWCPGDCWEQAAFLMRHGVEEKAAKFAAIYARMIDILGDADWIGVGSAFGGMAIYRAPCLARAGYLQEPPARPVCEHVILHERLAAEGCRIFINPRFHSSSVNEYSRNAQVPLTGREHLQHAARLLLRRLGL